MIIYDFLREEKLRSTIRIDVWIRKERHKARCQWEMSHALSACAIYFRFWGWHMPIDSIDFEMSKEAERLSKFYGFNWKAEKCWFEKKNISNSSKSSYDSGDRNKNDWKYNIRSSLLFITLVRVCVCLYAYVCECVSGRVLSTVTATFISLIFSRNRHQQMKTLFLFNFLSQ